MDEAEGTLRDPKYLCAEGGEKEDSSPSLTIEKLRRLNEHDFQFGATGKYTSLENLKGLTSGLDG